MKKQTFGLIVTTRDFFPSHLAVQARREAIEVLTSLGYHIITVGENDTRFGAIVSYQEACICAQLFKSYEKEISGIIVILPNFGEETGVAEAISQAGLNVPVLIQACNDNFDNLNMANRRDAFCGKISVCNNLYYRNIHYTTTSLHTCSLHSEAFKKDVEKFAAICRIVHGLRGARIAAVGTRPNAFNTVRFSERLLQQSGITVCTLSMTDVIEKAKSLKDHDPEVQKKRDEIIRYGTVCSGISEEILLKQAKLCISLENIVTENHCVASAIECWDSVQNHYGCATCLGMSMMGEKGLPSACEMDVTGAITMYALQLASQSASAYMDWNNNVDEDPDRCICLHCSNFPKSFFGKDNLEIGNLDVLATTLGSEKCFGACKQQVAAGPFTFAKLTTDDITGSLKLYTGTGTFENRPIHTKGGLALCHIDNLQMLMQYICKNGFEHHVAMTRGNYADVLAEAFGNYLGSSVYHHNLP